MSKRPEGQGKPKSEPLTPIEEVYRALRDVQDKGLMLTRENVGGIAETIRQAAIYDASRRERERELQGEAREIIGYCQTYSVRYRVWKRRAKRWAAYGVALGFALGYLGASL
tara:strand:- start:934 stop:1269 length:336 start_codon:yes stop_codon:yes gene_type:complete